MAFMYSISEGICFGILSYTVLNVAAGKAKQVTPLMYILTVVFILKYVLI
jgi:AGZA family xanthine/uracil permease-like MFS transporter